MRDWRKQHKEVMLSYLKYLNAKTESFILKGDTALYLCYDLDRFSEDIDLDGKEKGLAALVDAFCSKRGFTYRVAKDTPIVERCFINYGNERRPLKIEVSYRRIEIPESEVEAINEIKVYGIDSLCGMKINAYAGRDKIRDLYDLTFICNN